MTIEFDQTIEDYKEFNYYFYWASPSKKELRLVYSLMPVILFFLAIFSKKGLDFESYGKAEYAILIFGILGGLFMGKMVRWNSDRQIRKLVGSGKNTDMTGPRTLTLHPDILIAETKNSRVEMKWEAFEKLAESEKYFFLFLTVNQALIIPKRIFSSEEEIGSLRKILQEKVGVH